MHRTSIAREAPQQGPRSWPPSSMRPSIDIIITLNLKIGSQRPEFLDTTKNNVNSTCLASKFALPKALARTKNDVWASRKCHCCCQHELKSTKLANPIPLIHCCGIGFASALCLARPMGCIRSSNPSSRCREQASRARPHSKGLALGRSDQCGQVLIY